MRKNELGKNLQKLGLELSNFLPTTGMPVGLQAKQVLRQFLELE
jgi:hypothetical protein